MTNQRNFSIVAHIDHGKSTLADRFLEITNTVPKREMKEQILDEMDLEREKGITIKLTPVRMSYKARSGEEYVLNLIDTPGHVDFTYEVSRSLACCEGAILVVDATQGIQAQTLSNLYLALENNLEIIPVINKIDLPNARVEAVEKELKQVLGAEPKDIFKISAKTGQGVEDLLEGIIRIIPCPKVIKGEAKALIFDSVYDDYQGVIAYVRVFAGEFKRDDRLKLFVTSREIEILEVGVFSPKRRKKKTLEAGEVGYVITGLKDLHDCKVGDTLVSLNETNPLPGYKKIKPMVFASLYPVDADQYPNFKEALEKLSLNDSSFTFEFENSKALGRGFRCGFLGLLHLEIIQERLKREFNLDLIITVPTVFYKVLLRNKSEIIINSATELPDLSYVQEIKEPWSKVDIIAPVISVGGIMNLVQKYRGLYLNTEYFDSERAILHYEMPLSSIISDFYDKLKSVSSGYASLNYELLEGFKTSDLVRLDLLVMGEKVDAFSRIVPQKESNAEGRRLVAKLKEVLPRKNFPIILQAAIGGNIIARETIKSFRKDVTAKLYGGDVTRKKKLLEKQRKGKKKMKQIGKVEIPQETFLAILKK